MTVLELVRGICGLYGSEYLANGGFERGPDTFHLRFDPESGELVQAIVRAAAFVHNVEHTELRPLGRAIDPDALERVLGVDDDTSSNYVRATFTYEELEVTADCDGNIWLRWE